MDKTPGIDYARVINLMKSILSLEYCLQYQIIPLNLERGCLHLGMVDSQDRDALGFAQTITNALGYSLAIERIDSQTHQLALVQYLQNNHTAKPDRASNRENNDSAMTVVGMPSDEPTPNLDNKATVVAHRVEKPQKISKAALEDSKSTAYAPLTDNFPEPIIDRNASTTENTPLDPFFDFDLAEPSVSYCLTAETLSKLTPSELWQELFSKILDGSISKLYLEQNRQQGKIVYSPDGIIESSFDRVALEIVQTLVREIKTLAKIPLQPLEKTKKVAIEKHDRQERLQLHIVVSPSQWGDNITLEVLRGDALKLYEQKQIKKMSEQALSFAQKLAKTLNIMGTRFDSTAIGNIDEIQQVKQEIERQLLLLTQWTEENN